MRRFLPLFVLILLAGCAPAAAPETSSESPTPKPPPSVTPFPPATPTPSPFPSATVSPSATPAPLVPRFEHIVLILLENKEFGIVVGNPQMPYFNHLAANYTLLTQHYAPTHPSLPNYLALIGGDTFGITTDCETCYVDAPSLPDLLEARGLSWKAYQEDMPSPCFLGSWGNYVQKHNPFIYFDAIRLDEARCKSHIVPLDALEEDIANNALPNFLFITPNLCNDAHDCELKITDNWLAAFMEKLQPALDAEGSPYLILLTWDEGQGTHSCCGLPEEAGGRVATILVSPQVRRGFQDETPYTHYSILKTISESWQLPYLAHAADDENALITAPWIRP